MPTPTKALTNAKYLRDTKDYWIGFFSMIDDDLPDGAFYQMHVDMAQACLDDHTATAFGKTPKSIDAVDIVHYYFEHGETA